MIDLTTSDNIFEDSVKTEKYTLKPFEPIKDERGFIYILIDTAYPDVFKVGMTSNLKQRLNKYNSDKPFKTAKYLFISKPFTNVKEVESIILDQLYSKTNPTSLTKEWFYMEHIERAKSWISRAENEALTEEI